MTGAILEETEGGSAKQNRRSKKKPWPPWRLPAVPARRGEAGLIVTTAKSKIAAIPCSKRRS
jgi:hypothetical protein